MKYVDCNICGAQDYEIRYPAGAAQVNAVVVCSNCGLMYANPRVQDEDDVRLRDEDINPQRLEKEALQVRDYATTRTFIGELFPGRGRLLDIGSGFGYLMDYFARDGWETLGIEPNPGFCQYAKSELGLNVITSTLDGAGLEDESIDVALMMHVIEHVSDPVGVVRNVYRVLKPGGLFVMETPRYDSLMFKIFGRRERSISCDGHIYFFTSDSLRKLGQIAGFQVLREDFVGRSLTIDRLMYNFGVISKNKNLQFRLGRLARRGGLNKIRVSLNFRDMERIYLRKHHS